MIKKIEYEDKVAIQNDESVAEINKVTDTDMNEIKQAVNNNADELEQKSKHNRQQKRKQPINRPSILSRRPRRSKRHNHQRTAQRNRGAAHFRARCQNRNALQRDLKRGMGSDQPGRTA